MNGWVYAGFAETYRRLGISFDTTYYESDTYKLGRSLILDGLERGVLVQREDGSVWANLEDEGLDQKILLRSDGTSVYMTQDVGTAHQRYQEYPFDRHIYVVGNEQNYHFVLALVLKKLGFDWADRLYHLSYGMVELPEGKMKSREGTVVDADDLMDEMQLTARQMSEELGKLDDFSEEEKNEVYRKVGLGALKYFILKVDPRKNMTFDPRESVDFNGHTGPFIQYTYARIQSVLRKAASPDGGHATQAGLNAKEIQLVRMLHAYPELIQEAAAAYSPSMVANYLYELAKEFNQYYHDHSILSADSEDLVAQRLLLTRVIGQVIASGMDLLGIEVPERM
jgi:arginyl-tRNA synthetase